MYKVKINVYYLSTDGHLSSRIYNNRYTKEINLLYDDGIYNTLYSLDFFEIA